MDPRMLWNANRLIALALALLLQPGVSFAMWKEVGSQDGIHIYERWIELPDYGRIRERKGEMLLKSTPALALMTLRDPARNRSWMDQVQQCYVLGKPQQDSWYAYTSFSLPWPFENREMVTLSRLKYVDDRTAIIEINSARYPGLPSTGFKRVEGYNAVWRIEDKGNNQVLLSLTTRSYVPPEFPRIVHDPVIRNVLLRNLLRLKLILSI